MSILNKKNALTLALVAGLGMAATAAAYTVNTGTAGTDADTNPEMIATADVGAATDVVNVSEDVNVVLVGSDLILGRTTGFTIRYDLNNGAQFGRAIAAADLLTQNGWTTTVAAGGGVNDNFLVVNIEPGTADASLSEGVVLTINGGGSTTDVNGVVTEFGQALTNLTALQTSGGTVSATVRFVDPVTAQQIMDTQTVELLESGDPVLLSCALGAGNAQYRIDVGTTDTQGPKTYFTTTGEIGTANTGLINLGAITFDVATGFTFDYEATDQFTTVIEGDFSAFANIDGVQANDRLVYLSDLADCSANLEGGLTATGPGIGVIDTTNNTVKFTYAAGDIATDRVHVCAEVPASNTVQIDATTVSATTTFTRGDVSSTGETCSLLPLQYNGSVVDVYHINPAGNTTAQSFIRVINPGNNDGTVTIEGIDDAGNAADGSITFVLPAGASKQLNSEDLETGNAGKGLTGAWGDGAGKWRATVTGEFDGMKVQSLNRNATDGTVTNLTDADSQGEQQLYQAGPLTP